MEAPGLHLDNLHPIVQRWLHSAAVLRGCPHYRSSGHVLLLNQSPFSIHLDIKDQSCDVAWLQSGFKWSHFCLQCFNNFSSTFNLS